MDCVDVVLFKRMKAIYTLSTRFHQILHLLDIKNTWLPDHEIQNKNKIGMNGEQ